MFEFLVFLVEALFDRRVDVVDHVAQIIQRLGAYLQLRRLIKIFLAFVFGRNRRNAHGKQETARPNDKRKIAEHGSIVSKTGGNSSPTTDVGRWDAALHYYDSSRSRLR